MNIEVRHPEPLKWTIEVDGGWVAMIRLYPSGEVEWVGTRPNYQRKGFATLLWNHLVKAGVNPKHSACRLLEGDRWARKVGGELPPLHTVPCDKCGATSLI